jgi:transcriptional antiterminator
VDVVSRRLELLKLEGLGFSQVEIVKELSQKCACSRRTVYNDFETRESWQPIVQSVIDSRRVLLKVVNRYEQIYRQASVRLLAFTEEASQLGALNTMLKANAMLC